MWLSNIFTRKNIFFIAIVLIIAITFETFQQKFYIERFNLYENVLFFDLFKNQSIRWIIWALCGLPMLFFIRKDVDKKINSRIILKHFLIIFTTVLVTILLIALVSFISFENTFSIAKFYNDYLLFFIFQKVPIFSLGYIAVTVILFLNFKNELLQIEVQTLSELKKTNKKLYEKLKSSNTDKAKILNIKIGNKRKILAVENITFLEADDYCVNVHTLDNPSYSMRTSLKALQEKLDNNFLRVHRKSIVNMKKVKEIKYTPKPFLLLHNNHKVSISKSNLKQVKEYLELH